MVEAHAIIRSTTPHPPGSFYQAKRHQGQEPDQPARADDVRHLVPIEIVWLMGLAGFVLSILAMVTPLRCYFRPCFLNRTAPVTPSYYHAVHDRSLSPQRPLSPYRRPSSVSISSSHSSTSTTSSTQLDTPNSEVSLQSILISSRRSRSTGHGTYTPTKRVSFKDETSPRSLSPAYKADRSEPSPAPVDVWALAVMADLQVLEESHTKEFSKANAPKRGRLTKNLLFSTRHPLTNQNPHDLSPLPSFSSTMSGSSTNTTESMIKDTGSRERQTRKKKLFCKHHNPA